jgi:hypothetical protein
MPTTRISELDHARLQRLARETGQSHQEVLSRALEGYERERLLEGMNEGFTALRADPAAWAEELAERAAWDATGGDKGAEG